MSTQSMVEVAFIAELKTLLDHDTHYPLNGPCEANCVEKAVQRYVAKLEAQS